MASPLHPRTFIPLPVGSVLPAGWLLRQLQIQAKGLGGHVDQFWPSISESQWIGGEDEGWERAPYWLDGFLPLALLLNDTELLKRAKVWLNYILENQEEDGWFGPRDMSHDTGGAPDPWPQFVLFKAFAQWYEATGDERILPAMTKGIHKVYQQLQDHPLREWAWMRWMDLAWCCHWLYRLTKDPVLLELSDLAHAQGYDWVKHFEDFRYTGKSPKWLLENHVVNHAMAIKDTAVHYERKGDAERWLAVTQGYLDTLDKFHGQATGMFSGDESLATNDPSQGTELCAVVELMFSLEVLVSAFGDVELADRLEKIAYNALPATFTPDMWGHQYVQQTNQVICELAPDGERLYTNNGPDSNLYGLEPNFGCCTANMHQGWPKLVEHLWMLAPEGGLVAAVYGPSAVTTTIHGVKVSVKEETEYPFREQVRISVDPESPVTFPLLLRIPAWAVAPSVRVNGEDVVVTPGSFARIDREWKAGDVVELTLPGEIRVERRYQNSVALQKGPLVYSLRIGEEFRPIRGEAPIADYEVHPTTPWNYAIDLSKKIEVEERPVGDPVFSPEGAPIVLKAVGRQVPEWQIVNHAAGTVPTSPLQASGVEEVIELIPYGCTNLRVTEFPEHA